jgi:hypothetical protein
MWPYPRHRDFEMAMRKASVQRFVDLGFTVNIQQVSSAIKSSGQHGWIKEFERKYGSE